MKKHNLIYSIIALIACMTTGCEVDIKDSGVEDIHELTVNALVTPDTTLIVTVTAAKSYKDFTIDEYIDFADYERNKYDDNMTAQDTIARITLRITDPANTTDYYRLKVRSAGILNEIYIFKDSFSSDDVLFKNVSLHKGYQGWTAGMSNVFNDNLINGKTYEFTVESRLRETRPVTEEGMVDPENKWIVVELQSISAEFFNYLNSVWLYRITDRDAYSEAVQIYSNVTDGYGIVGALATEKHIIRF